MPEAPLARTTNFYIMLDFTKHELVEGMMVAYISPGYREIVKAQVIGFTPKKVKLRLKCPYYTDKFTETVTESFRVAIIDVRPWDENFKD